MSTTDPEWDIEWDLEGVTNELVVIGPHGVGKTTLLNETAQYLEDSGYSVYVYPEWSYWTKIDQGTMKLQHWIKKQMRGRRCGIDGMKQERIFDWILLDRHEGIDGQLYTQALQKKVFEPVIWHKLPEQHVFHIDEDANIIANRIEERAEREPWREKWNEDDMPYLEDICERFQLQAEFSGPLITSIRNGSLEDTVETIMREIY